jgi:general secretion pathway protein C
VTARRLHPGHLLLAALLLAAAVLAWRAVSLALAPLPAMPPFAPPALADRALLSRVDPFFPAAARTDENLPVTALPFSLHGVRADSATGRGSAIIATGDGQQQVFAVGDTLTDGVTLAAIAADHVVLDRGGTREALWLDSGGGAPVQSFDPGAAGNAAPPPFGAGAPSATQGPSADPASSSEPDAIDRAPPPGVAPRNSQPSGPADNGDGA